MLSYMFYFSSLQTLENHPIIHLDMCMTTISLYCTSQLLNNHWLETAIIYIDPWYYMMTCVDFIHLKHCIYKHIIINIVNHRDIPTRKPKTSPNWGVSGLEVKFQELHCETFSVFALVVLRHGTGPRGTRDGWAARFAWGGKQLVEQFWIVILEQFGCICLFFSRCVKIWVWLSMALKNGWSVPQKYRFWCWRQHLIPGPTVFPSGWTFSDGEAMGLLFFWPVTPTSTCPQTLTGWWLEHLDYVSIILGISSSQLTNPIIFQRGWMKHQVAYHGSLRRQCHRLPLVESGLRQRHVRPTQKRYPGWLGSNFEYHPEI